jgi:hypothetical protein
MLLLNPAHLVLFVQCYFNALAERGLGFIGKNILLHLCGHYSLKLKRKNTMEESRINACIQFLFIPCAIGLA